MNIALLEDELPQAELMGHWLKQAGITHVHYATGAAFRAGIIHERVDIILMDWTLPDDDGLDVLVWLRKTLGTSMPVMFLTARAEEEAIGLALDKGADDYLVKPLRRVETLARINALARRGNAKLSDIVTLGGVHIDVDKHRATVNGTLVELTTLETTLAVYLLRNHGRLLTREELQANVWRSNSSFIARAIDTHVSRVRAKLGLISDNGFNLSTVYHRGYRLELRSESDGDAGAA